MNLGKWLQSLGLVQYEASFRENGIDSEVLPDLTDADLEKIGVLLGHRKRLLKAIERLGARQLEPEPIEPTTPHVDTAERRQITVMFCDLVGSTQMSTRLDPEEMRNVLRAYQEACSVIIARYGGFVAKFMGDGVLAYFGYPLAHEDDAERSVRAALEIVAAVATIETAAAGTLQARVGIATGLVVVGDVIGHGASREHAVVGDTPNLAARLQGLANAGRIVIASSTRLLLGEVFELKALGVHVIKGFDAPVSAWEVLRETENVNRFEASRSNAPLVGRDQEVALLADRWSDACGGKAK